MVLKPSYKKKLIALLKKFKLEELHTVVQESFPSISLEEIDEVIERLRLPLSPRTVAHILPDIYEQKTPSIDECDYTLCYLHLFDAILHSNASWSVAELVNNINELPDTIKDLDKAICRGYRSKALNANVKSVLLYDMIWSVVAEKVIRKKGGVSMDPPNFFVFKPDLDVPHLLYSPKNMDKDLHFQVYIESLGYNEYKLLDYEGMNAASMMACIERKMKSSTSLVPVPKFQPSNEVAIRGIDYCDYSQSVDRKKYANQVFTGLSDHRHITVECEELYARPLSSSSISDFYSTITFSTVKKYTVENMFKYLLYIGAVELPLPNYMLALSSTPSMTINVHPTNSFRVSIQ